MVLLYFTISLIITCDGIHLRNVDYEEEVGTYRGWLIGISIILAISVMIILILAAAVTTAVRKGYLRKQKGIVYKKPRPKSEHDFLGLLYCFIVLLCICVVSCPYMIYFPTVMAQYSLFVLKVPLNPKQTNKLQKQKGLNFVFLLLLINHYFIIISLKVCV